MLDSSQDIQADIDALVAAPSSWLRSPVDHYTPERDRLAQIDRNRVFHKTIQAKKEADQERERAELAARLDYARRQEVDENTKRTLLDAEVAELQELQKRAGRLTRQRRDLGASKAVLQKQIAVRERLLAVIEASEEEVVELEELKEAFRKKHDAIIERRAKPKKRHLKREKNLSKLRRTNLETTKELLRQRREARGRS